MYAFDTLVLAFEQPSAPSLRRAMWLFLALALAVVVLARVMVMLNRAALRRLSEDVDHPKRTRTARRGADAWTEAGRRVPLEDDPDVPREPPDDATHERGFNDRR